MKNRIFINNQSGVITIISVAVGLLSALILYAVTVEMADNHYSIKYDRIIKEREKVAKPKRLEYIKQHPELDEWVKKQIESGNAWRGFTEEQVRIANNTWDDPEVKEEHNLPLGADKILIYNKAIDIKFHGQLSYYFIKDGEMIGVFGLYKNKEFTNKNEEILLKINEKYVKIDEYLKAHPELDRDTYWEIKVARRGTYGLNKEQVLLVLGKPDDIIMEKEKLKKFNYYDFKTKTTIFGWSEIEADELWLYRNNKKEIYNKLYLKDGIVIE